MGISSYLAALIIPLNLCMLMLAAGTVLFIARRRRSGLLVACTGLLWVLFWSLPATSLWAGGRLEQRYPYTQPDVLPKAPAIVVLGGHIANNRQNWFEPLDKETAASRVDMAAHLYEADRATHIILSGAALDGSLSEAQMMANTLTQRGIPESALILENQSFTTYENALYSHQILTQRHIDTILLVTSALHMPRAVAVFQKQGLSVIPAPSPAQIIVPSESEFSFWLPSARALAASRSIIKEYAGMLVYWMRGWV